MRLRCANCIGGLAHIGRLREEAMTDGVEEFATELEAFASHLVTENQQLQHENKQLNALLKEYEQTLETVMGKFRGVAVCSPRSSCVILPVSFTLEPSLCPMIELTVLACISAARAAAPLILHLPPTPAPNSPFFRTAA